MKRKNRKKELKKGVLKICYRCFIITCFIISIVCLFKHQETKINKDIIQEATYIIQDEKTAKFIEDYKNGKIDVSQNVPVPKELQEKMRKEAEEKRKKEEARKKAEEEARKKAEEERKRQEEIRLAEQKKVKITSRGGSTTRESSGTKSSYQAYAKDLCLNTYGWTENDFNCLVKLVERESSWNPMAENKSSGAYGLFQALPASKMASEGNDYRTNYKTQIKWGCKYIKNRYGTPTKAWNFWQQHHWY